MHHHMPNTPWILGGTKLDLMEDPDVIARLSEKKMQPISFERAGELAKELGAYAFIPYSSLTQQNLKLVFDTAMRCVIYGGSKPPKMLKKGGNCVVN